MKPMLSVVAVVVLGLVSIPCRVVAVQDAATVVINMEPGQVMLEFVGQMVDAPTDVPRSNQFGFLSFIRGLKPIFMTDSPPFDQTTAKFGFFHQSHHHARDCKRAACRYHSRGSDRNLLYAMPAVRIAVG